jgi:general secretion pathway protein D
MASASAATNPNLELMGAGANEFSALMTVVNDERSNSVVVFGTSDDIRLVRELVDKLDIVLAQVRIEVVIAEVTLDDQHNSGISALGLVLEGDKLVGFAGSYQGVGESRPFNVTNGAITRNPWDLAAEISIGTTPRKRDTAIINVPAIVTSHGKKAMLFNGESRPVVTGQIQSGVGGGTGLASSSTVTQLPIGARLTVEPFIGVDGSVQLNVVQSLEDVTGEVLIDQNTQYVIGKRETESYITAKSGEIIVLGGFRKHSDTKSTSRLGPIPILGDIFGGRTRGKSHTEVIFFLRPTVLTNNPAVDNVDALKRIEDMRTRETIKQELNPNYQPPSPPDNQSVLDKILPK